MSVYKIALLAKVFSEAKKSKQDKWATISEMYEVLDSNF